MRVSLRGMADITNVNSMLLPELGPALPGPTQYEGGLAGLGQTNTSTYTSDQFTSTGVPVIAATTEWTPAEQASDIAAGDTLAATSAGNVCPPGSPNCSVVSCAPFGTYNSTTGVCDYTTTLVIGGAALFGLVLLMMAGRRR